MNIHTHFCFLGTDYLFAHLSSSLRLNTAAAAAAAVTVCDSGVNSSVRQTGLSSFVTVPFAKIEYACKQTYTHTHTHTPGAVTSRFGAPISKKSEGKWRWLGTAAVEDKHILQTNYLFLATVWYTNVHVVHHYTY